jgi:hypothetical protein
LTKIKLTFTSKPKLSMKSRSSLRKIGAISRKSKLKQQPPSIRRSTKRLRQTKRLTKRTSRLREQKFYRKTVIRQRLRKQSNLHGRRTVTLQKK